MSENIKYFINDTKKLAPLVEYSTYGTVWRYKYPVGGEVVIELSSSMEFPYYVKKKLIDRQNEVIYHEISYPNVYTHEVYGYNYILFSVSDIDNVLLSTINT